MYQLIFDWYLVTITPKWTLLIENILLVVSNVWVSVFAVRVSQSHINVQLLQYFSKLEKKESHKNNKKKYMTWEFLLLILELPYGSILGFYIFILFYLCLVLHFHSGLNYKFSPWAIEWFTLTSSLSLNVFCFFFSRADSRFKAALYDRISLLKCDKEWLWIPEVLFFPLYPFLLFLGFFWPGTRLAELHFRVFPSNSDQFKVISAWSGSQAVKKERE